MYKLWHFSKYLITGYFFIKRHKVLIKSFLNTYIYSPHALSNHTSKNKFSHQHQMMKDNQVFDKMFKKIVALFFVGFLAWAYQNTNPPPPKLCGSLGGPQVTGPHVTLRDGRHLAYNEYGVSRDIAKYKIVFVHGFGSCRYDASVFHPVITMFLSVFVIILFILVVSSIV